MAGTGVDKSSVLGLVLIPQNEQKLPSHQNRQKKHRKRPYKSETHFMPERLDFQVWMKPEVMWHPAPSTFSSYSWLAGAFGVRAGAQSTT